MKAFTPPSSRIQRGWELVWQKDGGVFYINVKKLGCLSSDLKKLRWAEELRVIQLYYFLGTTRDEIVVFPEDGVEIPLNQWVFDKVTNVIPSYRIKLFSCPSVFVQNKELVFYEPRKDVYRNYFTYEISDCKNLSTNTYRLYYDMPGGPAIRIL